MSSTEELLKAVIEGQKQNNDSISRTNEAVTALTESVNKLVSVEAAREEREKHQDDFNKRVGEHMDMARPILDRAARFQKLYDGTASKIFAMIVIALLAVLGFKFS